MKLVLRQCWIKRREWPRFLAVVCCVLAAGGCRERASRSDGPAASRNVPGGAGMNVLLISLDTTRADHLGCYGHAVVKTPNIDRLAAEGTRYAQCITSTPVTLPAHSTMLTGSYPFVHGARDNGAYQLGEENTTLAEVFSRAGYRTHAEVAAAVLAKRYGLAQGFGSYRDPETDADGGAGSDAEVITPIDADPAAAPGNAGQKPVDSELERTAEDIAERGMEWLRRCAGEKQKFFIFLHMFDPHWPFQAPERFAEQYSDGYYAEIAYADEQVGRVLAELDRLGLRDDTLVILTSDHGEGRGQHGEMTHGALLHDATLHVPLILRCPGQVPAGKVIARQVRILDIASTIADFCRIERTPQMQGANVLEIDPARNVDLACYADTFLPNTTLNYAVLRALRADGWKYVHAPKPELYHVAEDPLELVNLAVAEPERTAAMRERLRALIAASPDAPGSRGTRRKLDIAEIQKLQALGYLTSGSADTADATGSELDAFDPVGESPRDRIEEFEMLAMGLGALRSGEFDLAESLLKRFLERQPDSPLGMENLGAVYLAREQYDEALVYLHKSLDMRPESAEAQLALGGIYAHRGDFSRAAEHFAAAVELNPGHPAPHEGLSIALGNLDRHAEAIRECDAAIELSPASKRPRLLVDRAYWQIADRQIGAAEASYREALRLDARSTPAFTGLLSLLLGDERTNDAVTLIQETLKASPDDAAAYHGLAQCHVRLGNLTKAVEAWTRVAELLPDNVNAQRNLAVGLLMLGRTEEAIAQLQQLLTRHPNDTHGRYRLAVAQSDSGRPGEAWRTVQELLASSPGFSPAYVLGAELLDQQGKGGDALHLLTDGVEKIPEGPFVLNDLAWRLATSPDATARDGAQAVHFAEKASALAGGSSPGILDTLAAAYAEAGRFDDAEKTAAEALRLAQAQNSTDIAGEIEARLVRYRAGQAYRQPAAKSQP